MSGALAMQEWRNGGTDRLEQYWTDGLATQYEVRRHNITLAQSERNPAIRYSRYTGDGKVARDSAQADNVCDQATCAHER